MLVVGSCVALCGCGCMAVAYACCVMCIVCVALAALMCVRVRVVGFRCSAVSTVCARAGESESVCCGRAACVVCVLSPRCICVCCDVSVCCMWLRVVVGCVAVQNGCTCFGVWAAAASVFCVCGACCLRVVGVVQSWCRRVVCLTNARC